MSYEQKLAEAADLKERQRIEGVAAVVSEHIETMQGPAITFGKYNAVGCPKCRMQAAGLRRYYCVGRHGGPKELQPLRPETATMGLPLICGHEGEHLHGHCPQCGFRWLEETADADDIREAARSAS